MTTIQSILDRAAVILEDDQFTHWSEDELLDWLNDAYAQIVKIAPFANVENSTLTGLTQGKSLQSIPSEAVMLIDIHSNTVSGLPVRRIDKNEMDSLLPGWHSEQQSTDIQHFVFDPANPKVFHTYPTPNSSTSLEISYSVVPSSSDKTGNLLLDDSYKVACLDYILHRAYLKASQTGANGGAQSASYYQSFINSFKIASEK